MDSSNIFADLGLPDAGPHLLKAQIVAEIYRLASAKKLNQAQVGKRLGISQPEVSRMFKGHFREHSIERLMEFLTSFDRDVEIVVRRGLRLDDAEAARARVAAEREAGATYFILDLGRYPSEREFAMQAETFISKVAT